MFNLPNGFTILRVLLTPLIIFLLLGKTFESRIIALVVFVLATITDWYDGYLARRMKKATKFGAFLDPLADKILVSSAFFLFAYLKILELWMVNVLILRDFLITALRSYALFAGKPVVTSSLAKWKTFVQMLLINFLIVGFVFEDYFLTSETSKDTFRQIGNNGMFLTVAISIITGSQYLYENRSHLKKVIFYFYKA
ncbi:CDP-diacylglycerol--glycerol-3-phosphate 3-phosphatidyltransferase [bacterium]|nr:CDP-diacylglycerol--glycerol-3-phosphate 3-phosphatidyltransferase [bacterium]